MRYSFILLLFSFSATSFCQLDKIYHHSNTHTRINEVIPVDNSYKQYMIGQTEGKGSVTCIDWIGDVKYSKKLCSSQNSEYYDGVQQHSKKSLAFVGTIDNTKKKAKIVVTKIGLWGNIEAHVYYDVASHPIYHMFRVANHKITNGENGEFWVGYRLDQNGSGIGSEDLIGILHLDSNLNLLGSYAIDHPNYSDNDLRAIIFDRHSKNLIVFASHNQLGGTPQSSIFSINRQGQIQNETYLSHNNPLIIEHAEHEFYDTKEINIVVGGFILKNGNREWGFIGHFDPVTFKFLEMRKLNSEVTDIAWFDKTIGITTSDYKLHFSSSNPQNTNYYLRNTLQYKFLPHSNGTLLSDVLGIHPLIHNAFNVRLKAAEATTVTVTSEQHTYNWADFEQSCFFEDENEYYFSKITPSYSNLNKLKASNYGIGKQTINPPNSWLNCLEIDPCNDSFGGSEGRDEFKKNENAFNNIDNEVSVFPNPSSGFVQLRIPNTLSDGDFGDVQYKILNNIGEELLNGFIENAETEINLDLSHLSNGVYFAKIKRHLESKESINVKFIIQN